ncbi:MAG: hypothetical protein L0Y80_03130 [Ignavibacteriae bacterium]|nr:hypothetical protein [Ignavibacteriota bacterium]
MLATQHGRIGERYILAGDHISLKGLFLLAAEITGGIKPLFKLPTSSVQALAGVVESLGNLTNSRPWLSRELVAGLGLQTRFTSNKAQRELGYTSTPLRIALQHTYEWYTEHGLL